MWILHSALEEKQMKRVGKPVFFVVALLTVLFTVFSITGLTTKYGDIEHVIIKGVNQIRWGIDIRGGVDVTFTPEDGKEATNEELDAAAEVMRQRLVTLNITDYEVYTDDASDRIIVRFPWKEDEADFDAEAAIAELGDTAVLTFREGKEVDEDGLPTGVTAENIILEGKDVQSAKAVYAATDSQGTSAEWQVSLTLNDSGKDAFAEATERLYEDNGVISIWMDDTLISYPTVNAVITDGQAMISGNFDMESAQALANKINGGALPFKLETENYSTINPTLGLGARDAMVLSGIIAFVLVCIFMIVMYRLPGAVACIALTGQVGGMLAALTGFFPGINSFTLTIPGIAGIILSIGIGVDANIITAERIKEEIRNGKSIDGAVELGYKRAFSAIFDGNITNVIVAIILMGTFGPPDSAFAVLLKPLLFLFPVSTEGAIYSFGYTLLVGVIANFVFGIFASKYMMKSVSRFKCFRNPWVYGGKKNA
jgi:protein-export membrane protein SecD